MEIFMAYMFESQWKWFIVLCYFIILLNVSVQIFSEKCKTKEKRGGRWLEGGAKRIKYGTRSAPVIIGGTQIINESTILLKFVIEFSHLCLDINW